MNANSTSIILLGIISLAVILVAELVFMKLSLLSRVRATLCRNKKLSIEHGMFISPPRSSKIRAMPHSLHIDIKQERNYNGCKS